VLERSGPGGQAGRSMRIENYLGFPTGITGAELAGRAVLQANKFGAQLPVPTPVTRLAFDGGYSVLHLDGGEAVTGKCLLIATGAEYRRLGVEGCEPLEGRGVYYAATPSEAQLCRGSDVVVGGGADRLAAGGGGAGRPGLRADRGGPGAVAALVAAAAAVPAGNQPRRRVRGGGRAVRLGEAGRRGGRRGGDGGPVRPRVPEGN